MYVAPDSDVRFLTGVKLDPEHVNTIWWSSLVNQTNYFMGKTKYSFTDQTYQRVTKGVMRIGRPVADLYDCGYMMFRNTGFHNKWFYAFIDNVEYINNAVTEVRFTIDPIQTWYFEYNYTNPNNTLLAYVEREHSVTDVIGANILPEPIETGEYVTVKNDIGAYGPSEPIRDMCVIITICDVTGSAVDGKLYDGIYGGATMYAYNSTDVQTINARLAQYIQRPDAVVGMYMCPKKIVGPIDAGEEKVIPSGRSALGFEYVGETLTASAKLDGYQPRNRKLYTYPYNFWHVDNASGDSLILRYEFFTNLRPILDVYGTITQPVSLIARPKDYKNTSSLDTLNTETLVLSSYPICSWNMDAYKAWVAQNAVPIGIGIASNAASSAVGLATTMTMPFGGKFATNATHMQKGLVAQNAIQTVSNILTDVYKASIAADICRGNLSNGGANIVAGTQQFYSGRMCVTKEKAKAIDDFFDLYGYAYDGLAIPNISSRPEWNYVKTVGICGEGALPSDDAQAIDNYFNSGIRFWNWGDHIGEYGRNNRPASE
ncbi:MAG: hypothetical protein UE295_03805 [Acutalibacteraceae bacterium]|nr:hypothetical protein [Acutalibacteraceae bacterium]